MKIDFLTHLVHLPFQSSDALNMRGGVWGKPARHPCEVVVSLLDMAIELFKSLLPSDHAVVVPRFYMREKVCVRDCQDLSVNVTPSCMRAILVAIGMK